MQEVACPGSWPGHPHSRQVTAACFPGPRPLTQAPFPAPPPLGRPQAKAKGLGRQERGGARYQLRTLKRRPRGPSRDAPESSAPPTPTPSSATFKERPHLQGEWPGPGSAPRPWPAGRGGGQRASPPAWPPAPCPPKLHPREGGADKGSGPPSRPQTYPDTELSSRTWAHSGLLGARTGRVG